MEIVEAAKALAIELARAASDDKCHQVVVLNVIGLSPVTDFIVLGTGTSSRQIRAVAENLRTAGKEIGHRPLPGGEHSDNWMLVDFVDVVVHLFDPDARSYYDLDSLWGDAPRIPWERATSK
jgi:ribosome-associated protein